MTAKLKPWTFNAKNWRVENGYTTPEWEMYVGNMLCTMMLVCIISLALGIMVGRLV